MGKNTALIIGGGIGGPVAAMALQQAGVEAVIYEAHQGEADTVGSFLNLASNGLDVLRTLGLHQEVQAQGFPTPRMVMWSGTGKRLGEVANGARLEDGTVSTTLKRGLLHRVLKEQAQKRGIRTESGKRLTSLLLEKDQVIAQFEDGSQAHGRFLIGADGLHSRTRVLLNPGMAPPRYTGQLSLGGIAASAGLPATPGEYHMVFGQRAFFGYSLPPSGEAYWFANLSWPKAPGKGELKAVSPAEWKKRLSALFAEDAGPALQLIARTGEELAAYPIHDLPRVGTWSTDRVVLLGDAAHATSPASGQGAALAMEDAGVLARCLRDSPEPRRAFQAYELLRRKRVERVVRYSNRIGNTKVAGPVGRRLRDWMMPAALKLLANPRAQDWLYRHHIE